MTMGVRNLLSQAVLETSSCRSENLSPRRPTPVATPMTLPQKSERPPQPVDTSSQASAEAAEASLEDIPASISPIAAISRTRSVTPPVDELELQENANKALEDFLSTKASIDAHRWRAMWELSIAKTTCSTAVRKAKTTRGHMVQEAEATCSKAISKVEAWRALQAESFQREQCSIMWDLEEQVIQEESRSQANFLSAVKSPCTTALQSLKALWLLPTISYWSKSLCHLHLPHHRERPLWENSSLPPCLFTST